MAILLLPAMIRAHAAEWKISELGVYHLGGIHVLREADTQKLLCMNPEGSPSGGCYVGYRYVREALQATKS